MPLDNSRWLLKVWCYTGNAHKQPINCHNNSVQHISKCSRTTTCWRYVGGKKHGPLFPKRQFFWLPNQVKSRSRKMEFYYVRIVLKFDRHLGSLSNFKVTGNVETRISRLRDFARFWGKTSVRLVNRDPVGFLIIVGIVFSWLPVLCHWL